MATAHEQARSELESLASEIAARIVNIALPKLKQKFDNGSKQPSTEVKLPASVSRELFDKADSDLELIDEIFRMIYVKAEATLKDRLGNGCIITDVFRSGELLKRDAVFELTARADFA